MATWSAEQMRNAATIYAVGQKMGMSSRDIQIALITAIVESRLVNVNYGDGSSLGLFQQIQTGWGTAEQRMDPVHAATKFYEHLRALGQSRYQMGMGQAAQAVQRSAYPDRYAEHIGEVRSMWPSVQKSSGETPMDLEGNPYGTISPDLQQLMPAAQQQPISLAAPGEGATPSADVMLGAWGMNSPQALDPLTSGLTSLISPETNQQIINPMAGFAQGVDGWRKAVIQIAKSALGTPYVWGGTNLQSGVDCSGLIQAAFAKAGINLPRISYQQANQGQRVGLKGLQPGDLVAWDNSSRNNGADHIAIYIGNGMIIESPRPGLAVRIRHLGSGLEGGWGVHLGFN